MLSTERPHGVFLILGFSALGAQKLRNCIGAFGGGLKEVPVTQLGAIVIKDVLKKAGFKPKASAKLVGYGPQALANDICEVEKKYYDWPDNLKDLQVDEVIMGNVYPQGQRQNTARQATIFAGLPKETPPLRLTNCAAPAWKPLWPARRRSSAATPGS